ncbi:hypothetical protein BDF21DRAFT_417724 [Thamnidium elegans]|uniref:C3H1-type domain-containing protein n=1 Tax=Thamnidium elegans TaxID=101142 RepID=A0A8H7SI33_9FUNG|nr:hypothetical protein INT48_001082 [Thamnidium elegans]KAI8082379.1 hypothetical protein BDF21DRAFT_417724 [Thamnidium elegans]
MYTTTKRFPASCRFFTQGNCRAGQECHFAHILPFNGSPKNKTHAVIVGEDSNSSVQDLNSIQKAILNLELDQLEKKYASCFQSTVQKVSNTLIDLILPLENKEDIKVQLIIPYNYPDSQCTLQIQNTNMTSQTKSNIQAAFEDYEWHQMRHKTLVQQLDWLTTHFNAL